MLANKSFSYESICHFLLFILQFSVPSSKMFEVWVAYCFSIYNKEKKQIFSLFKKIFSLLYMANQQEPDDACHYLCHVLIIRKAI